MAELKVRKAIVGYKRDSYLGRTTRLNPDVSPIDCAIGYGQWGISTLAVEAHQHFEVSQVGRYPETTYDRLLKPALLERFSDARLWPEQIFFGHGSFGLAERLIHKLIRPGVMLGIGPQFNEIPTEFVAAGGTYSPLPIEPPDFAFPRAELLSTLRDTDCSVLYLDNPNNPLGRLLPLEEIRHLAEVALERGTLVLVDEAYGDSVDDEASAVHLLAHLPNLMVIRSFSKCLGLAAERVGYMFLSMQIARLYGELDLPFEPTLYAATLAAATARDREFLARMRDDVRSAKAQLLATLARYDRYQVLPTHPSTAVLTVGLAQGEIVSEMGEIGVAVEPGSAFRQTHGGFSDRFCRLRLPPAARIGELCRRIERWNRAR